MSIRDARRGRTHAGRVIAKRAAIFTAEMLEPRRLLSANVLTGHNDLARTGLDAIETQLAPTTVSQGSFGKLFSYPVDGQMYAQPLYVSNLTIPGKGTHNVVFVATEHDTVYAFDADNSSTATGGGLLWQTSLGPAAASPPPGNFFGGHYGPYGNITPWVGVTGTPVIDPATNTMYVDAFTNDAYGVYSHHIHALDITTGAEKMTPALVAATSPGNGVGGDGTTITFAATQELQRPALTLLNGVLYVAYGSYADTDPYHGWVLGFNPANLQLQSVLNTTPNFLTPAGSAPNEGAIWQAGAGPSSDGTSLYIMTGNGDFDAQIGDYGDSFIKVTPTANNLPVTDYFTPSDQQSLQAQDLDLGSAGPMVLPDSVGSAAHPHLLVGCGKEGKIYLIDRTNMGGYGTVDNVVQEVSLGSGTWSNPAYYNGEIYFHGVGDVIKAFSISNGVLSATPVAQGGASYGYPGATPSISSNGTSDGIVWDLQSGGILHAYDATTLTELYNSSQAGSRDQLGSYVNFTTPTIGDGHVFVGTGDTVAVFGLFPAPTAPPAAPSGLLASQSFGNAVTLSWTNNASNALNFRVERSTDGTNFTQIAVVPTVSQGSTAGYTDTAVATGETLYYRVRAFNQFDGGTPSAPSNVATIMVSTAVTKFTDTYSTNTAANYTESAQNAPPIFQDSWTVSGGTLNYAVQATNGWNSSVFLLNPTVASTTGLTRFTTSGDIIAGHNFQPGLVLSGDTSDGGFVVQEYDNGPYNNHLVLLRETGAQLVNDEGGTGNPPVLGDFGDISAHEGDTFSISGTVDRSGAHPVITVSIIDRTTPGFIIAPQVLTDAADPANYGGGQIGWRARYQDATAAFSVDNLTLQTTQNVINDPVGGNTINLSKSLDGLAVNWSVSNGTSGQADINDPLGLTINNTGTAADILVSSSGDSMVAKLFLNGGFSAAALSVGGGEQVTLGKTGSTLSLNSLTVSPNAKLDLQNNSITVTYGNNPDPNSNIAALIAEGKQTGFGIFSSTAASNMLVGYLDNAATHTETIKTTLFGDINLDGKVNSADYFLFTKSFGTSKGQVGYNPQFDFNGDGIINSGDYFQFKKNFGMKLPW